MCDFHPLYRVFLKVCHQNAFPTGKPRKETGGEEGKEVLEKLSKEQRVELLRMFNRFYPEIKLMDSNWDGYVSTS